ncbi:MAG: adenylosuccinate synthase [Prevotella sp.]|nr:adenylosuccinate synthase [Staphylococcus sp.]MCM1350194.1 adenylosuccinate synthase [Prevotella sp.]
MKKAVVVGTQWGDEGKGKITNYLSQQADIVVRYQGGDNAGHSIQFDGTKYALHVIPSGVFYAHIRNVLGNGVVLNPKTFVEEVTKLKQQGFTCENLYISDRAHVIFDYHKIVDGLQEVALGERKIGTTKKGIGPTYTDKVARSGIRVGDFVSDDFETIYKTALKQKNAEIIRLGGEPLDVEESYQEYQALADIIRPYVVDTVVMLNEAVKQNQKILFEGAQGALLDIDFGTYPYVTSSNPSGGGVCVGSGIGPTAIQDVIGVAKAYATRVGSGAFPTEFEDDIAKRIRETAHEYGTTTKRPRRIGWLDAVVLKYSTMINGLTGISLMLLDVLSGIETLKVCTAYELNGKKIESVPARISDFEACKPIYETLPGWCEDLSQIKTYEDLPANAKGYIAFIEKITGVPVVMVSVGPDINQTIIRRKVM